MRLPILLLLALSTAVPHLRAAARPELRGAWVDRSSLVSREEIRSTMRALATANFNAAFVNAWSRGYPLWKSDVFQRETGILTDPGYGDRDVLQEAIEEAQQAGLALVPWIEYGFVGGYSGYYPGENGRGPIFDQHPDWLAQTKSGDTRFPIAGAPGQYFYYMAHVRPDVQQFLLDLMAELTQNYQVPGIQFDRARYPQLDCGYDAYTVGQYAREHDGVSPPDAPADMEWIRWRAANLNGFVHSLYQRLHSVDWRTVVSNAPGVYPSAFVNFAQDYPAWMRESSLDFVTPQIYRSDAEGYGRELDRQMGLLTDNSRLVPGIDATNTTAETLIRQVQITRDRGLPGVVIWYYRALADKHVLEALRTSVFAESAPLPWK